MKLQKVNKQLLMAAFIPLFIIGCSNNDVYFKYKSVPISGWNKDSLCTFDVNIKDPSSAYNLYINIRNRGEYPYQNLWLFLNKITPDSLQTSDSVECYLADNQGKWLGSGIGSVLEMSVLYQQNIKFKTAGIYKYRIGHGMRDTVLAGINDIGIRVEKVDNK